MSDLLEQKFSVLQDALKKDPSMDKAFASNPTQFLSQAGIPLLPNMMTPAASATVGATGLKLAAYNSVAAKGEKVTVTTHWWGVDIVMNEKLTSDITSGIAGAGSIGTLVGSAIAAGTSVGPVGTVIGAAVGIICAAKVAQIKITDNGSGVHWPITWLQWGALVAAAPGGPASIAAAGMVFVHPVRN